MPTHIDIQLKRALAKMLSERRLTWYSNPQFPRLATLRYIDTGEEIKDAELLQLCWEVEGTLSENESEHYMNLISYNMDTKCGYPNRWRLIHATWQQKVEALAQVKE